MADEQVQLIVEAINKAQGALKQAASQIDKLGDETEKAGKKAKKSSGGFDELNKTIKMVRGAVAAFVGHELVQYAQQAAIVTYHRLTFDVVNARLWAEVDERSRLAYCEWAETLRAEGDTERASVVCSDFRDAFSVEVANACPACAPD